MFVNKIVSLWIILFSFAAAPDTIDLEHRVLHVRRVVKEYYRRDGMD